MLRKGFAWSAKQANKTQKCAFFFRKIIFRLFVQNILQIFVTVRYHFENNASQN